MIGKLIHFDRQLTVTRTTVEPSNIFVEQGSMTAAGIVENIAQTCAARIGYVNKYILLKGVHIGFIGAVRNFEIVRRPVVSEVLTTRVEVKEEVFGMTLANATVTCGDELIASTEMKIAVKEDGTESI